MKRLQVLKYILFLITLLSAYSCGGQFGGSTNYAGGGIGGTGITGVSVGKITAIDNSGIYVNGVKFSLSGTDIKVNGITTKDQTNLKPGMIVKVSGEFDTSGATGKALTVEFDNNIKGPVDSLSINSNSTEMTFTIVGKTIFADRSTQFVSDINTLVTFDTLVDGNVVEVSGFEAGDGSIHATYIELKEAAFQQGTTQIEIKGTITDISGSTFTLNNITVDFSNLGLPPGTLKIGASVEVKSTSVVDNNGVLVPTKIEIKAITPGYNEGETVEMEGMVTGFDASSPNDFKMNNQAVHVDPLKITIEYGVLSDISNDRKIEVKGIIHSNILDAEKISIESDDHKENKTKKSEEAKDPEIKTVPPDQGTTQTEIKETTSNINTDSSIPKTDKVTIDNNAPDLNDSKVIISANDQNNEKAVDVKSSAEIDSNGEEGNRKEQNSEEK